jgi:hypothetical protein
LKKLGIPVYKYLLENAGGAANQEEEKLVKSIAASEKDIDDTLTAATTEEKAALIAERSKTGPVLVYCTPTLLEELKKKREDIILIALGNVPEAAFLRTALDVANE